MTLSQLITSYDEPALNALANKGTLVRAKKDLAADRVEIRSLDQDQAEVMVVNATVAFNGSAITDVSCDCPATGICRHIVAAILALQARPTAASGQTEAAPAQTINLVEFSLRDIEAFAGKDRHLALDLAPRASVHQDDPAYTRLVEFTQDQITVTFPAGLPLKDALYKGPKKTWQRRAIAAAALALLQNKGEKLPDRIVTTPQPKVTAATLGAAEKALVQAGLALSTGNLSLARNHLFSTAISTRTEAAPRLAAQLRGLSALLDEKSLRDADMTPVQTFIQLVNCHALVRALQKAPDDLRLIGTLRRSYMPMGEKKITCLGAETWEVPSGARGFTAYFLDLEDSQVYRTVTARGAGTDFQFDPSSQWDVPLWSVGRPGDLVGQTILLTDALIAVDGSLAKNQTARLDQTKFDLVGHTKSLVTDWVDLAQSVDRQLGRGLRRRAGEAFLLLKPDNVSDICLDEINQRYLSIWTDSTGLSVAVTHPDSSTRDEDSWNAQKHKVQAGLVAIDPTRENRVRLIAIWLDGRHYHISHDLLPQPAMFDRMRTRLQNTISFRSDDDKVVSTPITLYCDRCLEAILYSLPNASGLPDRLRRETLELGISTLIRLDDSWKVSQSVTDGLSLAYAIASARSLQSSTSLSAGQVGLP